MNTIDFSVKHYRASTRKALLYLLMPLVLCAFGVVCSVRGNVYIWFAGQLLLGIFFFQCFILLHEAGHYSFFRKTWQNNLLGHVMGFISFIPLASWMPIHNLHHRWTGWRDKDPTTEGTVKPNFGRVKRWVVDIAWFTWMPLFTIAYRLGNYWSPTKLKKHLPSHKLRTIYVNQVVLVIFYVLIFLFFGNWICRYLLLGYLFGLMLSDVFILSQHSHIETPVANGEKVQPLKYLDQVKFTRSIGFQDSIARFIFFNFNRHELHHAFPGIPAYHLGKVQMETPNNISFHRYLLEAKKMSGMKFIFEVGSKVNT